LKNGFDNSLINDGTGTNQVILMLTILALAHDRSIIGIDEPEIHLHPKAQAELSKILLELSTQTDKQIIFTTHSEHILYPLLTSIASGKSNSLQESALSIYYFDTDNNGKTIFEKLHVDEYGRIKGGLRGFFEENINRLNEYVEAIQNENTEVKK
jgi:predicted ATPase